MFLVSKVEVSYGQFSHVMKLLSQRRQGLLLDGQTELEDSRKG
jgi:hypothetical protein